MSSSTDAGAFYRIEKISGACDAIRIALLNEFTAGRCQRVHSVNELYGELLEWWERTLGEQCDIKEWLVAHRSGAVGKQVDFVTELCCLYNWESDIWGADYARYIHRRQQLVSDALTDYFQTFRLVNLFYIVERCLKLLGYAFRLGPLTYRTHRSLRDKAHSWLFEATSGRPALANGFPFPFNVAANTVHVVQGRDHLERHHGYKVRGPDSDVLGSKWRGQNYSHLIERYLVRTRKWYRQWKRKTKRRKRLKFTVSLFDLLWHYSESCRYRPIAPSVPYPSVFLCNMNMRWIASTYLGLVECWLFTAFPGYVKEAWRDYISYNPYPAPIWRAVQRNRWKVVKDTM